MLTTTAGAGVAYATTGLVGGAIGIGLPLLCRSA